MARTAPGEPLRAADVARRARVPLPTVRAYMNRLAAAGVLERTIERAAPNRFPKALFTLVRDLGPEPPRVGSDGKLQDDASWQTRAWRAVRTLGIFGLADLRLVLAGLGPRPIGERALRAYIHALGGAGYLVELPASGPRRRRTWRLLPSRNTGPRAPMVRRSAGGRVVYDPNIGREMQPEAARAA
jgi:hypothetical protein